MKKNIIILLLMLCNNLCSQLHPDLQDLREGNSIEFKKITKDNIELNVSEFENNCYDRKDGFFLFEIKKNKDSHKLFPFRESDVKENRIIKLYFIFNNEVMIINVKNNLGQIMLKFKELKFKKGGFEIDFKKIAKEKLFKNKKMPEYVHREEIYLDTFPFEEDKK